MDTAANWVRGDSIDYDVWADIVGDARWSYNSQLPYMKKTESFHPASRNPTQHGTEGNVFVQTSTSTNRKYPLRETVRQSWNSLIGFPTRPDLDGNGGNPIGVADLAENRANGRRQVASMVYHLDRVTVVTGELVQNVLITTTAGQAPKATGVKLANGTEFQGRNTIISAGALRTPQLLMLSGIGPRDQLQKFGIPVKVDAPAVGNNLIDHISVTTKWKIRDPSKGYAPGSGNPLFDDERFGWGYQSDFMVSGGVEWSGLMRSIAIDEGATPNPLTHPMLRKPGRTFLEYVLQYSGADDGSIVTLQSFLFMPHSRGQVTLGSKRIQDFPIVNPNYLRSLTDRFVLRRGVRNLWRFANSTLTPMARDILNGEIVPDGQQLLRGDMTDDEINARMAANVR
jgi:choline dehydrogenase